MSTYGGVQAANSQAQPIPFNIGWHTLLKGDVVPRAIVQQYDFGASNIPVSGYTSDMTALINQGRVKGIQTLFVNNIGNNGPLLVVNPVFNQQISIPAGYQGYFPIMGSPQSGNYFSISSTGSGVAQVSFLNVFIQQAIWAGLVSPPSVGAPLAVSDAIIDAMVVAGLFNVRTTPAQVTDTDRSGIIAVGGVSQLLMAANASRKGWQVQNIDSNFSGEALWVNTTGPAQIQQPGSSALAAAASIGFPGGSASGQSSGSIYIIGASTGHMFTATEW